MTAETRLGSMSGAPLQDENLSRSGRSVGGEGPESGIEIIPPPQTSQFARRGVGAGTAIPGGGCGPAGRDATHAPAS